MANKLLWILIVILLVIASIVRFVNIEINPAWYTDEGTHIEIAKHLIQGKNLYLGITDSYLIAARLPLFEHNLAIWFRLVGVGMFQLRLLTAFIGILTGVALYRLASLIFDDKRLVIGVLAIYAVYPQAVIYSRFGFSYNLLALLIISGFYFLLRFQASKQSRYLTIACIVFGLGTIADFIGWSFIPAVLLIILIHNRQYLILSIVFLGLPFCLYALFELATHPQIFLHDLIYTLSRAGGLPLQLQIENLIKNVDILVTSSWWIPAGFIGLFAMKSVHIHWQVMMFVVIAFIISGRTVALYDLSAYYMIPFLPFVSLGVVSLVSKFVFSLKIKYHIKSTIFVFIIMTIFSITLWQNVGQIRSGFSIGIEHFLISASEANQIRAYLIDYAKPSDVIITSPTLAWMFSTQVTDFQIASLVNGDSVHFPATLYPERIAFDIHYKEADYAIVDNLWRDWGAVHMPYVAQMLRNIQTWDLIFEANSIQIYRNPLST